MKRKTILSCMVLFGLSFIACEEDENAISKNTHRIKETIRISTYAGESHKTIYTYNNEKIIEVSEFYELDGKSWVNDSKSIIEYNDDDFVISDYFFEYDSWELYSKYEFNFSDGLLREIIHIDFEDEYGPCHKEVFIYSGKN